MSSYEPINPINKLSDKVLSVIFDYLDVKEVKEASLVCRRWNHIIFHSPYIERFRLMLDDRPICARERDMLETIEPSFAGTLSRKQKQMKRKVQQQVRGLVLRELLQSRRCYRDICYTIYYDFVLQAMPLYRQQHLQKLTLDLSLACFTSLDIWITFAKAIPLMKQLHTLYLEIFEYDYAYNVAPIVQSNSVRHLTVEGDFPIIADMPALETYNGTVHVLHRIGSNMPRNNFDKMQKLTIWGSEYSNKLTINDFRDFFRRLPNIRVIVKSYHEPEQDLVTAMCETCSSLQELKFSHEILNVTDKLGICLLSNLTSLRRIQIHGGWYKTPVTASLDLSRLSNLEHLDLGGLSAKRYFIHNLPHSITKLALLITPENERSLMRAITSSMTQLTELKIELVEDCSVPNFPPIVTLRLLPLLKRLEMFKFRGGFFGESCLLNMNTPMYRLRKLSLTWCRLDTTHLKGLHDKFPKLKQLEFEYCTLISGDYIDNEYQRF